MSEITNQNITMDPYEQNKLFLSYGNKDFDEFCRLIDAGADVNCFNQSGESLIGVVIQDPHSIDDNVKFFDKLMSSNVILEQTNNNYDPLTIAIRKQHDLHYMLKILDKTKQFNQIKNRQLPDSQDPFGPPIFDAILTQDMSKINLLLEYDVDLKVCSWCEKPVLSYLLMLFSSSTEYVENLFPILLEKGAVVDESDTYGSKTIHYWARKIKSEKVFNLLVEHGADINCRNIYGNTPISTACLENNSFAVSILIKNNVNLNVQNSQGFTPLLAALSEFSWKAADVLFESNCNILLCDNEGNNAAHHLFKNLEYQYAGSKNISEYMELFLKNPKLLSTKNNLGKTPLDILKISNQEEYLKFEKLRKEKNQNEIG